MALATILLPQNCSLLFIAAIVILLILVLGIFVVKSCVIATSLLVTATVIESSHSGFLLSTRIYRFTTESQSATVAL